MRGGCGQECSPISESASWMLDAARAGRPAVRAMSATSEAGRAAVCVGMGTEMISCASPANGSRNPSEILRAEHPDDHYERAGVALLELRHGRGERLSSIGIVAAVEPEFSAVGHERRQPPAHQPLQAGRPVGMGDAGLESGGRKSCKGGGAQRCDGRAGVDVLVPAGQPGQRQIEQAVLVLVDEAAVLLMGMKILPADEHLRPGARRLTLQHRQGVGMLLKPDDARNGALIRQSGG